jgi:hypothetical protein
VYESSRAADSERSVSPVEAALLTRLSSPDGVGGVHISRPRGAWVIEAVHGRRAGEGVRPDDLRVRRAIAEPAPSSAASETVDADSTPAAAQPAAVPLPVSGPGPVAVPPVDERVRLLEEGAGWLDAAVEVERGVAQLAGARARTLTSFARCRPASWDRQPAERGAAAAASRAVRPAALTEVSEWAVAEVAARLRLSGRAASELLADSVELVEQLPGTLAALEAGDISWLHARALVELLRPVTEDRKALVEARVLPRAPRQTVAQLRECTKRAITRIDADAAVRRLTAAIRGRKVSLQPGEDGMAVLMALLPAPVARACHEALRAYAEACAVDADGRPDPRSLDERMADCMADLILRPDADGRSPVQVLLTVIAGTGTLTGAGPDADEPGEVDGETVPATLVRELAYAFGLMPRPTAAVDPAPDADHESDVDPAPAAAEGATPSELPARAGDAALPDGPAPSEGAVGTGDEAEAALAALLDLRRLTGTALAERPRIAVVDQLTGCLLALTDSVELVRAGRAGAGLGPPGETDGYRPSRPLDRFVRLRDRRCRFPGCRARIRRCDLDHRVPYPHGPTAHGNLEGLCEFHHRLSHQAPGWRLSGTAEGGLVWTLPGGVTVTTVPPRFGTDDGSTVAPRGDPAVAMGDRADRVDWQRLTAEDRRERIRALVRGRPARPGEDAAPF